MPNLCIGTRDLAHSLFRPQLARDFTDARDLTERLHALYRVSNPSVHPATRILGACGPGLFGAHARTSVRCTPRSAHPGRCASACARERVGTRVSNQLNAAQLR